MKLFFCSWVTDCWQRRHPQRPNFNTIYSILSDLQHSDFSQTSHEVFKSLQSTWKHEVQKCFQELKKNQSVSY